MTMTPAICEALLKAYCISGDTSPEVGLNLWWKYGWWLMIDGCSVVRGGGLRSLVGLVDGVLDRVVWCQAVDSLLKSMPSDATILAALGLCAQSQSVRLAERLASYSKQKQLCGKEFGTFWHLDLLTPWHGDFESFWHEWCVLSPLPGRGWPCRSWPHSWKSTAKRNFGRRHVASIKSSKMQAPDLKDLFLVDSFWSARNDCQMWSWTLLPMELL